MPDSTPYSNLKAAIGKLEIQQAVSRQVLQEQFKATYEKLNPFAFIKNSLSSITESPEVRSNLVAILLSLATGFISKKTFAGNSRTTTFKQAGILLIDSLNRYITRNPEVINTISHFVLSIFRKKKATTQQEE